MREQPTAQYGQREWTSLAPEMRRSSARFFAAATSKPSGLARGTNAMPAAPAAPSFRNSRRVISVIGLRLSKGADADDIASLIREVREELEREAPSPP